MNKISWLAAKILFGIVIVFAFGVIPALNMYLRTGPKHWTENTYYEGMIETEPIIESMQMRIKHLQMELQEAGFDPGKTDGIYGKQTQDAWNAYEKAYMARPIE